MVLDQTISTNKKKITPKAIRSSGDNLYVDQRKRLENWFKCNVFNSYQTQEGGLIAMDCKYKTGMHFFSQKSIIEVYDEDKNVINNKGIGKTIVTNLENWALPFIRYKMDDRVEVNYTECKCGYKGLSITSIIGRNSPYFIFNGKKFNPTQLNKIFENLPVHQFQIIQDKNLKINWIPKNNFEDDLMIIQQKILDAVSKKCNIAIDNIQIYKVSSIGRINEKIQRYIRIN